MLDGKMVRWSLAMPVVHVKGIQAQNMLDVQMVRWSLAMPAVHVKGIQAQNMLDVQMVRWSLATPAVHVRGIQAQNMLDVQMVRWSLAMPAVYVKGIQAQSMLDGKVVPCTAWSTHEGLLGSDHTGWVSFHSLDCSKCKAPRFEGTAAVCFRIGHPLDGLAKIIGAPGAKQERVGKKGERSKGQHAQDAAFGFIHPLLSWQGVKSSRLKA
eukprot:1157305-Pelagomonas_calceolata.AAC.24